MGDRSSLIAFQPAFPSIPRHTPGRLPGRLPDFAPTFRCYACTLNYELQTAFILEPFFHIGLHFSQSSITIPRLAWLCGGMTSHQ